MPHSCPMQSVTWGNSAYTSDSGSCDPTLLVSVVGVTDRARLSLGFEPCDARLYCLGVSHVARLTWQCVQADVAPDRWRLHRPTLSRHVSLTYPFTSWALAGPSGDRWAEHIGGGPTVVANRAHRQGPGAAAPGDRGADAGAGPKRA